MSYADENRLEEWVHEFLHGEGKNLGLSGRIKEDKPRCKKPTLMRLDLLQRIVGWESNMPFKLGTDEKIEWFWNQVDQQAKRYSTGDWDMPPLMAANLDDNDFYYVFDGNHRLEALKKLGIDEYWVIVFEEITLGR